MIKEERKREARGEEGGVTAALTTFKHGNYVHYFPERQCGRGMYTQCTARDGGDGSSQCVPFARH